MPSTSSSLARVLSLAAGEGKKDKDDPAVDYGPSSDPAVRCGTCAMFRDGTCTAVKGRIDPRDVCLLWEQAPPALSVIGLAGTVRDYERTGPKGQREHVRDYKRMSPEEKRLHWLDINRGHGITSQTFNSLSPEALERIHDEWHSKDTGKGSRDYLTLPVHSPIWPDRGQVFEPEHVTLAHDPGSGFVEGYERVTKGKLEHVSGYPKKEKVMGPVLEGTETPASHGIFIARTPEGTFVEVQKSRLWTNPAKGEGKAGPAHTADLVPGAPVTWRFQGKTMAGVIHGPHGTPIPEGATAYPTNGTFIDAKGGRHWGWYGGAGILLHHTDDQGVTRYLLQRRAYSTHHGGTYSTPGGAIDKPGGITEDPAKTAFREAEEEGWGNLLPAATVTGVEQEHFGGGAGEPGTWTYNTVSASVPEMIAPSGKGSHAGEATGYKWATPEEMTKLPLHPDFLGTAIKLGRPADVPNPKPSAPPVSQAPRHPLVRDDYKPGQRVTWTKGGEQHEGFVQEGAVNAKGEPITLEKNKLPLYYPVALYEGGKETGKVYPVNWNRMRLHISEDPGKADKVAEWEKNEAAHKVVGHGMGGGSLQPKYGYGPSKPGKPVLKAHSLALPGLTHTVPAKIHDAPVVTVYEHPKRTHLLVHTEGDGWAVVLPGGKIGKTGSGFFAAGGGQKALQEGWKSLPVSPPQAAEGSSASPLGKVVEAHTASKWAEDWEKQHDDPYS